MTKEERTSQQEEKQSQKMSEKSAGQSGDQKAWTKAATDKYKDPVTMFTELAQGMDPQKIFSVSEINKEGLGSLLETNLQMMRAYDKMFKAWASGFSARNEERIHTLEEAAKSGSHAEAMKLHSDCLQSLTKHWVAENQALSSIFLDAFGKSIQDHNMCMASAFKNATDQIVNP